MIEVYYLVSAKCQEAKAFDGVIMTHDDKEVWFSESNGHPTLDPHKEYAKKFKKLPSRDLLNHYDGYPWYFRIKPDTLKIVKIVKESYYKIEEEVL